MYENRKIELSMGIHHGKREKPIVVYASHLPKGTIKEIECCFDHGLYLAVTYEDGQKEKAYEPGKAVGVDLGEVHTIGAFCEHGQAILITGRKVRSLHRLRNKKLAEIQRRQSKCQKGPRQWKSTNRRKNLYYPNPKDSYGCVASNDETVCRLVLKAVRLRCVYRKRQRSRAEHKKEYTSRHVLSAKRDKKCLPACLCAGVGMRNIVTFTAREIS
ncbi:hypothetical protein [Parageobacillus sp. VR-IP]|uniref:hypothetical protein n=1 Tax=Parageobacillus sp. VR-IP TaxID=2742205 RepID=UPI0020C78CDA|nr:hypothetical protein [Parageobacillus sp. VR-IP]